MSGKESFLTKQEIVDIFKTMNSKAQDASPDDRSSQTKLLMKRAENQLVWIKNEEYDETNQDNSSKPFYQALVINDEGNQATLKIAPNEQCREAKFLKPFERTSELIMDWSDMADKGLKDMIDIDELNHATVLWNLYKRYCTDDIYTYVGPTLLAVNPFKSMKEKYPPECINDYKQIIEADSNTYLEVMRVLPPHVYAISSYAHKQMTETQIRQAIVISGESGAGKTESAKQCMQFLTMLGSKESGNNKVPIGDRILSTNPVLEAFGNSRTARNNNSSRFGKYIKLYFDYSDGKVLGAEIKNYLLEKSRVVGCTEVERNYHIFFFMMRGIDDAYAKKLGLQKSNGQRKDFPDFKYMQKCNDLSKEDDIREYHDLMKAYVNLGFTDEEVSAIHNITAACLHFGELEIDLGPYKEGSTPVGIKNMPQLDLICKLLGITDTKGFITELVNKEAMKGIAARTPDKPKIVEGTLDALAKGIYDNMFNWLVAKMNIMILPDAKKSGDKFLEQKFEQETKTIGLLDIFGFENFELNQFEQLCINYVNEKLHNLYISSIFGAEKKEMEREGIDVQLIPPPLKVLDVLKLMDNLNSKLGPLGIFQTITEKSGPAMGKDDPVIRTQDMFAIIAKNHSANEKVFKAASKMKTNTKFTISHSAKDVTYNASNFIERNTDSMSQSLVKFMLECCDKQVSQIFSMKTGQEVEKDETDDPRAKGQNKDASKEKSIWGKFSIQIINLMYELAEPLIPNDFNPDKKLEEELAAKNPKKVDTGPPCEKCDLHFIRCLKPNDKKVKNLFVHAMTLQQITYMGVLESIKVKQENFPYRKKYEDFYRIYELLSPQYSDGSYNSMTESQKAGKDWKALSEEIIKIVFAPMEQHEYSKFYACGKTKILKMGEIKAVLDASKLKASLKYDKNSKMLKRTFSLIKAQDKFIIRKAAIIRIQRAMKACYQRIQVKRANIMQQKINDAIIAFKTKQRKEFEMDAAEVIEEVYRKHVFRDYLIQGIQSRSYMMKGIFDLASINRCRKMWICKRQVMKIVDKAFKQAKKKKEQEAVYRIQRIVRGHMERNGKEDIVLNAVKSKVELKQHVSAKRIQKKLKGIIVRRRLHYLNLQVEKLQATFRMRWTRKVYLVIKRNVIILQKAYRRYMARRDQIKVRLYKFLTQELQVLENVKAMEYSQLHGNLVNRSQAQRMGLLKTLTPYSIKKIHFFTRVIDLSIHLDLSDIYTHPWSTQWLKAMAESTQVDTPIMNLNAGGSHTMVVNSKSRVFVWGWNDNGQCCKPWDINEVVLNQPSIKNSVVSLDNVFDKNQQQAIANQGGIRIKQSLAVQDRCFLLLQDTGDVISWGGNEKGQLGHGHYEDTNQPQKIEAFSKQGLKISFIAAGGNLNFACSEDGQAFAWPFFNNGIKQSLPTRMPFSEKTKIQKVTCGHNFGFFISNQGLVYAFGEDNSDGQLGLGHTYPTEYPELITCFRDVGEKIDTIECGFKHSIAKSSLGKIYTWGSSAKGQLGHGHYDSELSPRTLYIDKKNIKKVNQIAAGYSHSIVMMDTNKEIYWFGTCGNIVDQCEPIQFDFARYMPDLFGNQHEHNTNQGTAISLGSQQQDFAIVKVNCSWSKTMSISNVLIADLRAVNQETPHAKLISTLKTLNQCWDPKDIMPPYIDTISNLIPTNIMKKEVQKSASAAKSAANTKK